MLSPCYKLECRKKGELIEVTQLGTPVCFRLMDKTNLSLHNRGYRSVYYPLIPQKNPFVFPIPYDGEWFLVPDSLGRPARVSCKIKLLPPEVETQDSFLQESSPIIQTGSNESGKTNEFCSCYDVFISHASEDKKTVARPLFEKLSSAGLKVWYDESELKIGDSLRRKIDEGLNASKFWVVILSKDFFRKDWTKYEFDSIVTNALDSKTKIFPIWHNIGKTEVKNFSPNIADKLACSTASESIDSIVEKILQCINESKKS